jgi:hybrid polyketide synthase/nonribosomal peptide synthetase ACE1
MMTNSYKANMERDLDSIGTYHVSGASRAMMSNRLSFFFDWHGPSMYATCAFSFVVRMSVMVAMECSLLTYDFRRTIDTACSSSLIAVHQAVMQLRTGQSRFAIAAGSNLLLDPTDYVAMCNLEMLSPEGRSRMWDRGANGYARGEGVAAVVLKTLSAAEADGDHIECIIRETATNQDGRTPGITM